MLTVFTVSNLDDFFVDSSDDAPGTLRQAIFDANDAPGSDSIEFEAGLSGTINLSFGQLPITDSVEILGPGRAVITIDGQQNSRLFLVDDGNGGNLLQVAMSGLTLTSGRDLNGGGAIFSQEQLSITDSLITGNEAQWGAIYNAEFGDLTVTNSEVTGNTGTTGGGGIYNWGGTAEILDSVISGNDSATVGGGLINANNGSTTITRTTISGNTAATSGGGLFNSDGQVAIVDSTFSGNQADYGGGIYVVTPADDTTTVTGSTISNNNAPLGGAGLYNENGKVLIEFSTVTENISNDFAGSGITSRGDFFSVHTEILSSIIAGNHHTDMAVKGFPNSIASLGYNLVGVFGYESELEGTDIVLGTGDPLLGPLTDNGGPTFTHALLYGSQAIEAGDPLAEAGIDGVPEFDQRGSAFSRDFDADNDGTAVIDIGAVESHEVYFVVDTPTDESDGDFSAGDFSLREAIEQAATLLEGTAIILFDSGLTSSGQQSIHLDGLLGQLQISGNVVIEGPAANLLTIVAAPAHRLFFVDDNDNGIQSDVAIRGLTLTGANYPGSGGAVFSQEGLEVADSIVTGNAAQWGGGIYNAPYGEITVINSEVSGNDATSSGGGIYNWGGTVFIFDSKVSGNEAPDAAGMRNANNGAMSIMRTTVSGNIAQDTGGGLRSDDGNVFISHSTFSGNQADRGGGIFSETPTNDTLTITNSTVSSNIAPLGGAGVFNASGHTLIQFSTLSENNSNDFAGSGVVSWGDSSFALTEIYSTIIAGNHHTDVALTDGFVNTFESLGYNVIGTGSVDPFDDPGDWVIESADPGLGPLADNGGPTMTHALLPGSPAIDQGDSSLVAGAGSVPFFDQRGVDFDRIRDGNGDLAGVIDVGAFELQESPDEPDSADFDGDGDVDGRDFLAWQRGFGTPNAIKQDGDSDNDEDVDGTDLGIWQDQYGTVPPLMAVTEVDEIALHIAPLVSVAAGAPESGWHDAVDAALAIAVIERQGEAESEPVVIEDLAVEITDTGSGRTNDVMPKSVVTNVIVMELKASDDDAGALAIEKHLVRLISEVE